MGIAAEHEAPPGPKKWDSNSYVSMYQQDLEEVARVLSKVAIPLKARHNEENNRAELYSSDDRVWVSVSVEGGECTANKAIIQSARPLPERFQGIFRRYLGGLTIEFTTLFDS